MNLRRLRTKTASSLSVDALDPALDALADGLIVFAPDGRVVYANRAANDVLPGRNVETGELVERARLVGRAVSADASSGRARVHLQAVPLRSGNVAVITSDLSEADRLDAVRRDLVANVSHELKTPAATIQALAETVNTAFAANDYEAAKRFVQHLEAESVRLTELVTDLLDLSRVETAIGAGTSVLDLGALLQEVASDFSEPARSKGIDLEIDATGRRLRADGHQLAMAVKNLIDNAIRYSEGGRVSLTVHDDEDEARIVVSDEGMGIPAEEIPRIFERFYRVDKARSRSTGGTGLGLAIVRHVAENHGGRVEVTSEPGKGSTFVMILPKTR